MALICILAYIHICTYLSIAFYVICSLAAVITDGTFGSSLNLSLFENITCSENAIESSLTSCTLYSTDCLPLCPNNIAIRCFSKKLIPLSMLNCVLESFLICSHRSRKL